MKVVVGVEVARYIAPLARLFKRLVQLTQPLDFSRTGAFDCEPGGESLECSRDRKKVFYLLSSGFADDDGIVGAKRNIAFGLEGSQRIAQRRRSDLQRCRHLRLGEGLTGTQLAADDRLPEFFDQEPG